MTRISNLANSCKNLRFLAHSCALSCTCFLAIAGEPVRTSWIMSKAAAPGLERVSPDVHSVEIGEKYVVVRSSGVSLKYFGPLQPLPFPEETVREFVFRIPRHPEAETGRHARVPVDVIGAFVNGLPIYNQFETLSYNAANLWHYDAVANNDDGTLTASGHPRTALSHPTAPGLIEQLIESGGRHSPLIGFALDGYPVYGPWAYDGNGGVRRMRSSYRLRSITRRHEWPDGTRLTPEQFGPDVSSAEPLGTFAEDYEYARGLGDLDEFNGRFSRTPEYPDGTYAYFLATNESGRLAYPYLVGPRFYGRAASVKLAGGGDFFTLGKQRVELRASELPIRVGHAVRFRLEAGDASGERIRDFEYVHERPIHLLVASADLAEFDHIHPELAADDSYEVTHTFEHGGRYRIWADYSLPGEAPRVDVFDVNVEGSPRRPRKLAASQNLDQEAGSLRVRLEPAKRLRAGEDIPITLKLMGSMDKLEPYLGAWAHVIVVREDLRSFSHAHPIEIPTLTGGVGRSPDSTGGAGIHTHMVTGPPPSEIHITTSFPSAGLYKLWVQLQENGKVLTVPFVVQVGPAGRESARDLVACPPNDTGRKAEMNLGSAGLAAHAARLPAPQNCDMAGDKIACPTTKVACEVPVNAVRIRVTQRGYEPAIVEIPAGTGVTLAFTRESSPNCGSEVVFPALGIRKALPLGQTVLVNLPAQSAGEIGFSCGVGMYRGMMVAR
jgi:hypothetical protein